MICVVCHEEIQQGSDVHLECGHHFHGQCITDWLWTKQSCPLCRNQPDVSNNSDSDSDESEHDMHFIEHQQQEERRKTRRKTLNNIIRRKSLQSNKNVDTLKKQMVSQKNILKTSRSQLQLLNKAIAANDIEHRKKAAQLRRVFRCKFMHMNRVNKEESKHIRSKVKSLEKTVCITSNRIYKMEEKVLEYA